MSDISLSEDLLAGFTSLDRAIKERVGFRLFTILLVDLPDVIRLYSSDPEAYPVSGRKTMGPTPWGAKVIDKGEIWFGENPEDLKWAFPDHELIASLGCGSCINIPVVHEGVTLGSLNILDAEGSYGAETLIRLQHLAVQALPLFQQALAQQKNA